MYGNLKKHEPVEISPYSLNVFSFSLFICLFARPEGCVFLVVVVVVGRCQPCVKLSHFSHITRALVIKHTLMICCVTICTFAHTRNLCRGVMHLFGQMEYLCDRKTVNSKYWRHLRQSSTM